MFTNFDDAICDEYSPDSDDRLACYECGEAVCACEDTQVKDEDLCIFGCGRFAPYIVLGQRMCFEHNPLLTHERPC